MKNKQHGKHLGKRSGFTLIEIILVVVIIGILAGIAIPRMGGKTKKAQISQAQSNIAALSMAVQEYEMINGQYPPSLELLLMNPRAGPSWRKSRSRPHPDAGQPAAAPPTHPGRHRSTRQES